jgi:hypothetical protein
MKTLIIFMLMSFSTFAQSKVHDYIVGFRLGEGVEDSLVVYTIAEVTHRELLKDKSIYDEIVYIDDIVPYQNKDKDWVFNLDKDIIYKITFIYKEFTNVVYTIPSEPHPKSPDYVLLKLDENLEINIQYNPLSDSFYAYRSPLSTYYTYR